MAVFLFGTLRHLPLLRLVCGDPGAVRPARLPGWRVAAVAGQVYPVLVPDPDGAAEGLLISPDAAGMARMDHYEDAFGYVPVPVSVLVDDRPADAVVYRPETGGPQPLDTPWSLDGWVAQAAPRTMVAAEEVMSYMGRFSGAPLRFRRPQIEARAQARVRAGQMPAPQVGWPGRAADVQVTADRADHAGYFVTRTLGLRHPTFTGGRSEEVTREVFVAADAAIVLPYDPVRDRILLVEQFRMGPFARGAAYPWMLEPVAGRIDPGETPEACARREAEEEAGLTLREVIPIGSGYPSPGCMSEYFYIFAGLCDLPDGTEGLHGMADEAEDIRTHILDWSQAMDLLTRGEADNVPLVLALVWLSRERSRLRASG